MIEVKNITKVYGKKKNTFTALKDVSLTIPDGAKVAIIGKSGSGKSTLMHAMSGLDRPQKGQVIIDGQDILKLKSKQVDRFRAEKIGFIFQSFFLEGNQTAYNNVSLPLEIAKVPRSQRKTRILTALKGVDLQDKVKNKAKDLSGGQRQRLVIARAIVNQPKIIFADEPTGNLDSVTGDRVVRLLFGYSEKKKATLILVTHDQELADKCEIQIYIKDGVVERVVDNRTKLSTKQTSSAKRRVQ